MANSQDPFDQQLRLSREQAANELAVLGRMDESTLTARMLVRKAMLLQLEDTREGTAQEIEAVLLAALDRDDKCIEAYIELGRYYYSILDDSPRARLLFLKGLRLLRDLNKEIIQGLVDCDTELHPDCEPRTIQTKYEAMLLEADDLSDTSGNAAPCL